MEYCWIVNNTKDLIEYINTDKDEDSVKAILYYNPGQKNEIVSVNEFFDKIKNLKLSRVTVETVEIENIDFTKILEIKNIANANNGIKIFELTVYIRFYSDPYANSNAHGIERKIYKKKDYIDLCSLVEFGNLVKNRNYANEYYIRLSINSKTLAYFIYKYLNNNYKNYNFDDFDEEIINLIINDYFGDSDHILIHQLNGICDEMNLIKKFATNEYIIEWKFTTNFTT